MYSLQRKAHKKSLGLGGYFEHGGQSQAPSSIPITGTKKMRHPIQHLRFCTPTARLYAAASNVLLAFDASSGCLLSAWTAPADPHGASEPNPNKKRKVEDTASSPPPHGGKGGKTRQSLFVGTETNNAFAELLTTRDGKYVVTANSEDKAVRVFSTEDGRLEVLSTR